MRQKQARISQLKREKEHFLDIINRVMEFLKFDHQTVFGDLLRVVTERFKAEGERLESEHELDKYEDDLNTLIRGSTQQYHSNSFLASKDEMNVIKA